MPLSGNFHPEWGCLAPAPDFMRTARIAVVATAIGATSGAVVVLSLVGRPAASPAVDADRTLVVVHSLVQPVNEPAANAPKPSAAVAVTAAPAAIKPTTIAKPMTVAKPTTVATSVAVPPTTPSQMPINAQASVQTSGANVPARPPLPSSVTQAAPVASDAKTTATPQTPASASLAEVPPVGEAAPAPTSDRPIIATDPVEPHKSFARKRRAADYDTPRGEQSAAARKRIASKKQGLAPFLRRLFTSARNVISYNPN